MCILFIYIYICIYIRAWASVGGDGTNLSPLTPRLTPDLECRIILCIGERDEGRLCFQIEGQQRWLQVTKRLGIAHVLQGGLWRGEKHASTPWPGGAFKHCLIGICTKVYVVFKFALFYNDFNFCMWKWKKFGIGIICVYSPFNFSSNSLNNVYVEGSSISFLNDR